MRPRFPIIFLSVVFLFSPFSLAKIKDAKPGFKPEHKILTFEDGSRAYFRPRNVCSAMVPVMTFHLGQIFELPMVPKTQYLNLESYQGIAMAYLEGFQPVTKDPEAFLENISIGQLSKLSIVRHLSGAFDENPKNYLFKGREVKAIDNDGSVFSYGQYSDWPYESVNPKIDASEVNKFPFAKEQEGTYEELLALIKKRFPTEHDQWKLSLSAATSKRLPKKVKYVITKNSIWVKRVREGLTYQHLKYVSETSLLKLKSLDLKSLQNALGEMQACEKQKAYLELLLKKRDDLLKTFTIENDFYISKS